VLVLSSFSGDDVRYPRLVLIVVVSWGIQPILEQAVDPVEIKIDDRASCKTFGRSVLETLYEVNRTRHV